VGGLAVSTETQVTPNLEELYQEQLCCNGIHCAHYDMSCNRPAILVLALGAHRHHGDRYRCLICWAKWNAHLENIIDRFGHFHCHRCDEMFYNVESFSVYRPI